MQFSVTFIAVYFYLYIKKIVIPHKFDDITFPAKFTE